jgi:hypothetical protein
MSLFKKLKNIATKAGGQHEIDDIKATIGKRGGLARPNRFVVIMTPPNSSFINKDWQGLAAQALTGSLGFNDLINDPRDIAILCKSCSFPGRTINTLEYELHGFRNQVKVPYTFTNEDVSMTFHLTNDYYMKNVLEKWQGSVIDVVNQTLNYKNDYTADIIIQQLNSTNHPIYGIKLTNAYPTAINSVALDNAASDTTQELQVTFAYDAIEANGAIEAMFNGTNAIIGGVKKLFG